MKLNDAMRELKSFSDARNRKTLLRHGAPCDALGVKVGDLKKIAKKIKVDQKLSEELYDTGLVDAMYLAGIVADPQSIKRSVLKRWASTSPWSVISEYAVAPVAAESPHGWNLGLDWIDAKDEETATIGWNTLSGVVSFVADEDLDVRKVGTLLTRIKREIHKAPNRVRYTMNGFVISVGCYVTKLNERALEVAEAIGEVSVDLGKTACKVPYAPEYISKVVKMGRLGKKRKHVRC